MKHLTLASIALVVSSSAIASPIFINSGYGTTSSFNGLGSSELPVTSTYSHGLGAGVVSSANDLIGQPLTFNDFGFGDVGQLFPLLGSATTAGFGDNWKLTFSFNVSGTAQFIDGGITDPAICAVFPSAPGCPTGNLFGGVHSDGKPVFGFGQGIGAQFNSGTFGVFYEDLLNPSNNTQVLGMTLASFDAQPFSPNVVFNTKVDFSWYGGGNSFVENFFIDSASGKSLFELDSLGNGTFVTLRTVFNIDPNYVPLCVDAACETLARTSKINPTSVVTVPEPASLAILGAGLLGMGFVGRRRRNKAA